MKSIKQWAHFVFVQALLFGGLYAWKFHGIEPAANAVIFFAWFAAIMGILSAFMPADKPIQQRGAIRAYAGWLASSALVLIFAAIGHFVLATMYLIGAAGMQVWRKKHGADGKPLAPAAD